MPLPRVAGLSLSSKPETNLRKSSRKSWASAFHSSSMWRPCRSARSSQPARPLASRATVQCKSPASHRVASIGRFLTHTRFTAASQIQSHAILLLRCLPGDGGVERQGFNIGTHGSVSLHGAMALRVQVSAVSKYPTISRSSSSPCLPRCFMEFMSDPANAAAGSNAPEAARGNNPSEFGGQHDRNLWLLATLIYQQSYQKETGGTWNLSPSTLWKETCEEPSSFRNPVPTWMWRRVRHRPRAFIHHKHVCMSGLRVSVFAGQ